MYVPKSKYQHEGEAHVDILSDSYTSSSPENPHCPRLEYVSYSCVYVLGVGNGSLKVDDADIQQCRYTGGPKGAAVLNHEPIKVLRLSTINPVASRKPDTRSLHQKLAAG